MELFVSSLTYYSQTYIQVFMVDVIIILYQIIIHRNSFAHIERDFALWYLSSTYIFSSIL